MNIFKRFLIRFYQKVMYIASYLLRFNEPVIIKGNNSFDNMAKLIKNYHKKKVLLVTDENLHELKYDELIINALKENDIEYSLYYHFMANPTIMQVEQGVLVYQNDNCDCIVVLGGGSAMDGAKIIGARVTNNKISINKMKGLFKLRHKLPLLIAIPTTAGTGSETTIAAVISNNETKEKFAIEDLKLIPSYAILNPSLLVNLPSNVTSTTGMDALTHAIEAYIGNSNTKKTKKYAMDAIQLIFKYLYLSYENPTDLLYREKMQLASYYAGIAFTRAYVGYVHAIAHTLGGFYKISHGLANAVILPIVLKEYGKSVEEKLSQIYDSIYLTSDLNKSQKANAIIEEIISLNKKMNIPDNFKGIIQDKDIPLMVNRTILEANPLYPVPELWSSSKFEKIFKILQG